jgi:predicted acyltransferase
MGSPNIWRRLEGVGVFLVALHSLAIGIMLVFATAWVLDFAGWDEVSHLFFPRQSGAFHIILAAGYVWDGFFPMNKSIWTSSYVVYTAGLALNFLAICYWFIDVKGYKKWAVPFQVYGLNAITVFFLSGMVAKAMSMIKVANAAGDQVSVKTYLFDMFFLSWLDPINASLLWAIVYIAIWLGLMWILYAKKIFIKV